MYMHSYSKFVITSSTMHDLLDRCRVVYVHMESISFVKFVALCVLTCFHFLVYIYGQYNYIAHQSNKVDITWASILVTVLF